METQSLRVLVVDEYDDDRMIVRDLLASRHEFVLLEAARLDRAFEILAGDRVDVVLLDLNLPDSGGLDTVRQVRSTWPGVPCVVLTGAEGLEAGALAVQHGAQDFLSKSELTPALLHRALLHALERHRLLAELDRLHDEERRQREMHQLERLSGGSPASLTARMFSLAPLRESSPATHADGVSEYARLLDLALDERAFKVDHHIGDHLRRLAGDIGRLRVGPRDVVQIHLDALRSKTQASTPQKTRAYTEEGRMLLVEFMGHLVEFYRGYFFGR